MRNQVDFILKSSQFRRFVKSAKTYLRAGVDSDHNPVVMAMKAKRCMAIKKTTMNKDTDIRQVNSEAIKNTVSESLEVKIKNGKPNAE